MRVNRRQFLATSAVGVSLAPIHEVTHGRMRVALAGAGRHGLACLAELAETSTADIVAICDPIPARLAQARRVLVDAGRPAARVVLDFDEIMHPDVDALFVATPDGEHRRAVEAAVAAGKHVWVAAPAAACAADTRAIVDACTANRVVVHVGHARRFYPAYAWVRNAVRSGSIGECLHVSTICAWAPIAADPTWEHHRGQSLGRALKAVVEQVDAVSFSLDRGHPLTGRAWGGSYAVKGAPAGHDVLDTFDASLVYEDSPTLSCSVSCAVREADSSIDEFVGTAGVLRIIDGALVVLETLRRPIEVHRLPVPRFTHAPSIAHFLRAIDDRRRGGSHAIFGARAALVGHFIDRVARVGWEQV